MFDKKFLASVSILSQVFRPGASPLVNFIQSCPYTEIDKIFIIVKIILDSGADVNEKSKNGNTALMLASFKVDTKLV